MAWRRALAGVTFRIGAVGALHVVLYSALLWLGVATRALPGDGGRWQVSLALLLMALLNSALLSYLILRSRWWGSRLSVALGAVFYGAHSVMEQLDSLAFPHVSRMTEALSVPPVWLNIVFTLLFVPLAVSILGRGEAPPGATLNVQPVSRIEGLLWKIPVAILLHELVFVLAGYWIARAALGPSVGIADIMAELQGAIRQSPSLPGLQVFRASVWVALSLPLVASLHGTPRERSLAVGVFWAVASAGQLVFARSDTLEYVSRVHVGVFVGANFLAGVLLGALLGYARHASSRAVDAAQVMTHGC